MRDGVCRICLATLPVLIGNALCPAFALGQQHPPPVAATDAGAPSLVADRAAPSGANEEAETSREWFADPPNRYRPSATLSVGKVPVENLPDRLKPAIEGGYGSIMIFPAGEGVKTGPKESADPTQQRMLRLLAKIIAEREARKKAGAPPPPPETYPDGHKQIGPLPRYLGDEYFRRYAAALALVRARGMTATLYDELGYPSGFAGGGKIDPANFRKLIIRTELSASTTAQSYALPAGRLLAAVAMNDITKQRIDLTGAVADGVLRWKAPGSNWSIQFFDLGTSTFMGGEQDYHAVVDYFDPKAVQQFIDVTYSAYKDRVGSYFGNTITRTFFDDVGIYSAERTWAASIAVRFKAKTGRDPAIYYPALWEDIGPDTAAARVGFFASRAELLGEGFPAIVTRWGEANGVAVTGHAPGQYEIQPTDMNGDPFKFYAAQPIPMIDVIFDYGFGRDGFKLVTSAADTLDKPIVLAEQFTTCGTTRGYKRAMDSFVRGVNSLITCSINEIGPPSTFGDWSGRISMMLQGGRRVSDIAIIYPIASLQAFYTFDAPGNQDGPVGRYAPKTADYLSLGDRLTGDLHRDFTFLHPDDLASARLQSEGRQLILDNRTNRQVFKTVILPGGAEIQVGALRKLEAYWDGGGNVIATTLLPSRAAEFGKDTEVRQIVARMFGPMPASGKVNVSAGGGRAVFLEDAANEKLAPMLEQFAGPADIIFGNAGAPRSGNGMLAYIHKVKAGKDIIYIANSSDDPVVSTVSIRGAFRMERWDPVSGTVTPIDARIVSENGMRRTMVPLSLGGTQSIVLMGSATDRQR